MISVTLQNFTAHGKINSFKITDITAAQSQIGEIDTDSLRSFFNVGAKMALPLVN
jgi:hypothetical protein